MVITEQLLYTYHSINDDNVVIEVLTDTDLSKLQKLVLDLQKQTGYQYLYCGRKYHAIHWQIYRTPRPHFSLFIMGHTI